MDDLTDYISVDIDSASHGIRNHDPYLMLIAYLNARYMFPNVPIQVKTTRKGFHIKIKKRASVQEDIEIRRLLGDDSERLWYSEQHVAWNMPAFTIDVLFESKEGNRRVTYTREIYPLGDRLGFK